MKEIMQIIEDGDECVMAKVRFDFNETCMVNSLLTRPDKRSFINKLKEILKDEDLDLELHVSINKLIDKFEKLSENQVRNIYNDRVEGKVNTFPQYTVK